MEIGKIREAFMGNMGCAQIVAGEFAEETGLSQEQLFKMGAAFDGGMMRGETCGAVIAAYNVLGLIAGHCGPDQDEQKGKMLGMILRFNELLGEKRSCFMCREMLDADIRTAEGMEKIIQGGLMMNECPLIINDVLDALKQVIREN